MVISQVHWDHVGEPRDFPTSNFVIGNGAYALLKGAGSLRGSHSFFEADLLPADRTIELSNPYEEVDEEIKQEDPNKAKSGPDFFQEWKPHGNLPRVLDLFHDGSVYIVDAPGHLPGHINILAKTGPMTSMYLAGDACHDRRIMRNERQIGEWRDEHGHICCIHADKKLAEQTIGRIQELESKGIEVVFAHDFEWEEDPKNQSRFFGQD
jgi:glyoxylase-like metal-dependent hydrolase (beta-lactamase superfamily II)